MPEAAPVMAITLPAKGVGDAIWWAESWTELGRTRRGLEQGYWHERILKGGERNKNLYWGQLNPDIRRRGKNLEEVGDCSLQLRVPRKMGIADFVFRGPFNSSVWGKMGK
jgi:hypothetical protein